MICRKAATRICTGERVHLRLEVYVHLKLHGKPQRIWSKQPHFAPLLLHFCFVFAALVHFCVSEFAAASRVGRAGRFGTKGLAVTFVASQEDTNVLNDVQTRFEVHIPEMPATIDASQYINQ